MIIFFLRKDNEGKRGTKMDANEFEALLYKYLRSIRRSMGQLQQGRHHFDHHGHPHMGCGPDDEIPPAQAHLLMAITRQGMQKISDLGKVLEIPDSHVSNMCRKLEKRGLVERVRDEGDNRVVRVRATEKMIELIKERHGGFRRSLVSVFSAAPTEDLQTIITGLEKLNALLENANGGPVGCDAPGAPRVP